MNMPTIRFQVRDLVNPPLPEPGYHDARVHTARLRISEQGNTTLQVTFHLPQVDPECDRVIDYFVLIGASEQALAISRRRLVALCRACGIEPEEDKQLLLTDLEGRTLEVRIGHKEYEGSMRACVLGCRAVS